MFFCIFVFTIYATTFFSSCHLSHHWHFCDTFIALHFFLRTSFSQINLFVGAGSFFLSLFSFYFSLVGSAVLFSLFSQVVYDMSLVCVLKWIPLPVEFTIFYGISNEQLTICACYYISGIEKLYSQQLTAVEVFMGHFPWHDPVELCNFWWCREIIAKGELRAWRTHLLR